MTDAAPIVYASPAPTLPLRYIEAGWLALNPEDPAQTVLALMCLEDGDLVLDRHVHDDFHRRVAAFHTSEEVERPLYVRMPQGDFVAVPEPPLEPASLVDGN